MTPIESSLKSSGTSMFNVEQIRSDFPILKLKIDDKQLVYLDNAASSQMPTVVMDRMLRYQTMEHANINRAVHYLSETATAEYEKSRHKLKNFINANEDREIIFTSGTTDAINLAPFSLVPTSIPTKDPYPPFIYFKALSLIFP